MVHTLDTVSPADALAQVRLLLASNADARDCIQHLIAYRVALGESGVESTPSTATGLVRAAQHEAEEAVSKRCDASERRAYSRVAAARLTPETCAAFVAGELRAFLREVVTDHEATSGDVGSAGRIIDRTAALADELAALWAAATATLNPVGAAAGLADAIAPAAPESEAAAHAIAFAAVIVVGEVLHAAPAAVRLDAAGFAANAVLSATGLPFVLPLRGGGTLDDIGSVGATVPSIAAALSRAWRRVHRSATTILDDTACVVCLDSHRTLRMRCCNAHIHSHCLQRWRARQHTCAHCRAELPCDDVEPVVSSPVVLLSNTPRADPFAGAAVLCGTCLRNKKHARCPFALCRECCSGCRVHLQRLPPAPAGWASHHHGGGAAGAAGTMSHAPRWCSGRSCRNAPAGSCARAMCRKCCRATGGCSAHGVNTAVAVGGVTGAVGRGCASCSSRQVRASCRDGLCDACCLGRPVCCPYHAARAVN